MSPSRGDHPGLSSFPAQAALCALQFHDFSSGVQFPNFKSGILFTLSTQTVPFPKLEASCHSDTEFYHSPKTTTNGKPCSFAKKKKSDHKHKGGASLPDNARHVSDSSLVTGSGRSPGEENGNPLQYSCLGNPMDRGAWWAIVHGVAKESDTM